MSSKIRMSALAAATLAALSLASTASAGGRPDLVAQGLAQGKAHEAGQLIVTYASNASQADKVRAMGRGNAERQEVLVRGNQRIDAAGGDVELVRLRGNETLQQAIDRISADRSVLAVEPNWTLQHAATSNDTYFTNGSLWGMYSATSSPANQFGSGAAQAWTTGTDCSNVVIGIIDEGYMHSHDDLAANAFKNPGDSTFDGVDNDGNGLVDDVYGWDFAGNNNSVFDGTGDDHGTHVAGTIGGVGGNGNGVAGVCWSVKLMGAKFLGSTGGTTANAIKAVDYFTDLKLRHGLNLVATNNSWGGGGFSQALMDAISRANNAGILFIAAAGNSGTNNDTSASYPSNYDVANVIAVASHTSAGALSSFSQYGATTVDISAPGSGIWSSVPVASGRGKKATVASGYARYDGTSMATPHVTGAAAMYAARHPGSTAAQIKAAILDSAIATPAFNGKVAGNRRLNVAGF